VVERLGPEVPMHFTAFHPDWKMRDLPPTPLATLERARGMALRNGLRYPYTGNVSDPGGSSTWCHGCGALLIERDRYRLGLWQLDRAGRCSSCDSPVAGRFAAAPERFGNRSRPLRMGLGPAERERP